MKPLGWPSKRAFNTTCEKLGRKRLCLDCYIDGKRERLRGLDRASQKRNDLWELKIAEEEQVPEPIYKLYQKIIYEYKPNEWIECHIINISYKNNTVMIGDPYSNEPGMYKKHIWVGFDKIKPLEGNEALAFYFD